jgi:hypothetical protein
MMMSGSRRNYKPCMFLIFVGLIASCNSTGAVDMLSKAHLNPPCLLRVRDELWPSLATPIFALVAGVRVGQDVEGKAGSRKQDMQKQPTAAQNAVAGAIAGKMLSILPSHLSYAMLQICKIDLEPDLESDISSLRISAGFTARMAVAPVDLAKIRLQIQQGPVLGSGSGTLKYRGMLHTMKTVAREEGFLALWKGNIPAQLMVMTFVAIKFSAFNSCRNSIEAFLGPTAGTKSKEEEQVRLNAAVGQYCAGATIN